MGQFLATLASRIPEPANIKPGTTDDNGNKISTKTEWQGDELVSETRTGSGKLTDTYQVSSDGKQLTVISRYESSSLSQPLTIRRVYDLGGSVR